MLSGSLETFSSTEVLRLVAGTRKTGALVVRGRGPLGTDIEVDVRVRDGQVAAATGGGALASDTTTCLADMLRITDGEFTFDAEADAPAHMATVAVDDAIADAEAVMAEWQVLETYVPSLDAAVELSATVDGPVTIDPELWTTLSAIGSGCTARTLAKLTGHGPLEVCRTLRRLVELRTVRVIAAGSAADDDDDMDDQVDEPTGRETAEDDQTSDLPLGPSSADLAPPPPEPVAAPVAARFRHFSPRAAAAVAATEPGHPPSARPDGGDEVVSRNLLLKFLDTARQTA